MHGVCMRCVSIRTADETVNTATFTGTVYISTKQRSCTKEKSTNFQVVSMTKRAQWAFLMDAQSV